MPRRTELIPVVLAGGFGTRIRPLSANRPKPMLPVVNRPILERVLERLVAAGLREAIVLTYHEPAKIRAALGNGDRFGMELRYFEADRDHGTAGAVARGARLRRAERYLVLSGDVLTDLDLGDLLAAHASHGRAVTIALTRVPNPLQFGIVIIDGDGQVRHFLEKPTWGEVFSDTVNTGAYVVEERALEQVPEHEAFDFSRDLFPRLLEAGVALHGHVVSGYWRDVGDPESYLAAHADFFDGTLRLVPPGSRVHAGGGPVWLEEGASIEDGAEVRGTVVVGAGCRVHAGARLQDVVLGPGTVVGPRAEVRRTVTWEEAVIGPDVRVESAVIGARVRIGTGAVVEAGTVVADDTVLGSEVRVKEGVKIWPAKVVEDRAVVHSNLVYADRWRTSAFEEGAVTGLTNLELTPEVAARLGAAYATLLPPGCTVLSVRDAHPASRMLRRAFVGGVGSAGVNMVDLGLQPVPVMRHKLESFGEMGGVAFDQVPLVRGMTAVRFYDERGLDIATAFAKSVERIFTREEFRRVQHGEIGAIFEQPRILDFYAECYLKALAVETVRARRFRLVVDYAHSPAVVVLPRLLAELGCEVVTLNAHTEGSHESLLADEIDAARGRLAAIVTSLGADLGVFLDPSGERLALVDRRGRVWTGMELVGLVVAAVAAAGLPPGEVALPAYAPSAFKHRLAEAGHHVRDTLSSPRALTEASRERNVIFASAGEGDFIFPALHHAPDALFAAGSLLELAARADSTFEELAQRVPPIPVASVSLACPLERKGEVMRRFVETLDGADVSYLEGVKVAIDGGWALLRPDRAAARLHLHTEAGTARQAQRLLARYRKSIERLVHGEA